PHRPPGEHLRLPACDRDGAAPAGAAPGAAETNGAGGGNWRDRAGGAAVTVQAPAPTHASFGPPILTAEDVVKEFGGLVAVNDVSIDIPTKAIVSIIGPNGAGKTTFFNMLTGLYKP